MHHIWPKKHAMSIEEISQKTGLTEDSVKHTLSSAIRKLRDGRATVLVDLMNALSAKEDEHVVHVKLPIRRAEYGIKPRSKIGS